MTFSPTVDERQLKLVHFFPDKIAESATTRFAAKHRQRISKRISGRTEKVTGQQTTCVLPWVVAAAAEVRIIPRFRHLLRAICQKPRRNSESPPPPQLQASLPADAAVAVPPVDAVRSRSYIQSTRYLEKIRERSISPNPASTTAARPFDGRVVVSVSRDIPRAARQHPFFPIASR